MRISIACAVLAASVLALCFSPHSAHAQGAAGTKVAVIDITYVFKYHNRFKAAMEDIKKDITQFETIVLEERKQIGKMGERMAEFKPGSAEYKRIEEEGAKRASDLQVKMALKRKEFLSQEAVVFFDAYTEVTDIVAQFAEREGINLVLRFSSDQIDSSNRDSVLAGVNRTVVYQRSLNITRMILDQLNRGAPGPNVGARPQIPNRNRPVNR